MYCKNCEISFEPKAVFCDRCGKKLDILEPKTTKKHTFDDLVVEQAGFKEMPFFKKILFILILIFVLCLSAYAVFYIYFPELYYSFYF